MALLGFVAIGGVAQSGRALPSHGRGQGFESPHLHDRKPLVRSQILAVMHRMRIAKRSHHGSTVAANARARVRASRLASP
jgi:hypothetical protein